ncbi:hypothetical protein COY89_03650 [Candidatus Roizmanbacteria bacterium CG_4_10_14_0_8_um_filter_36_36]|uniref:Nucleotidyl transferase AbiEii/AbiGii toxin family protein n=1 Tax=Candidatus Roizmanbacteria bacterium CG10_big_fil_rev_8_21_14_0_10_36_26 TaxID=1974851 RepID=A0A2M8KM38_9BACT|nr:MAG: hypothetical protein COS51_01715 [Candidatus Roizmanbacteria bacterium CG03_land_8_20_14_0_80_36_21]PIY69984.1 MAG: hypothetical protein COY89_03650 [Candidatus Roizmanbacteria bacterium CG_4_10_14_0_8_um_filter_36_36]PJA52569.1 MAG: hypothetical protein CO166_05370 [Candidatus Roizmanbacteria bacterium CG_4_9_14_3_um_filter_36_11]PJE60960.1 MAG: hypothetical protein COU86_01665 [Candidatus Roizmanbacteria bacterium CG10_big_fil_rev_8_21_14_0_10_36_26]
MITKKQAEDLAKYYQIDELTIIREYLQILFLSYLYKEKQADKIYFKGGTAIRLLFGSSRFSEDLDFSTPLSKTEIKKTIKIVEKSIQKELPGVNIFPLYTGKKGLRFRLKYQADDYKYPLVIRLDFNEVKKIGKKRLTPLVTKFPIVIFPLIIHLTDTEILAEKLCALLTRGKGRDFYDSWFLLEKSIKIDTKLLKEKLRERGKKFKREKFLKKIKTYPQKQLVRDLSQFLPRPQRRVITMLKSSLEKSISRKLFND